MPMSLRLCGSVLLLCSILNAQKTSVVTVAGGYQGNHKPALSASFASPGATALDAQGTLYIGDSVNCQIRKIEKQGTIVSVAGGSLCGFGGDGGKASSATLSNYVGGMLFDGNGNLLFVDSENLRVRKISPTGIVSTIVGNGTFGYSGDGGPATQAQLAFTRGITLDAAGNLYIADSGNNVIREVDTSGTIRTIAGNHTPGYSGDGGPAMAAQLNNPASLAVDSAGNLYIGDFSQHIRKVDTAGIITTIAGNGFGGNAGDGGPAIAAAIGGPQGLLLNGNVLYISTFSSVWWLDLSSGLIHLMGGASGMAGFSGDGGPALAATLNGAAEMVLDSQGNLLIGDAGNDRVREIGAGSQIITTVAGGYIGDGTKVQTRL